MRIPLAIVGFRHWDVVGSILSSLCALHCLAMPFLYGVLPMLGLGVLGSRSFERGACLVMASLAAMCLWRGALRHRRWWLLMLWVAGAGTALMVQWMAAPECCPKERTGWTEAWLMFSAGSSIAVAHCLNLRFIRRCGCSICPG